VSLRKWNVNLQVSCSIVAPSTACLRPPCPAPLRSINSDPSKGREGDERTLTCRVARRRRLAKDHGSSATRWRVHQASGEPARCHQRISKHCCWEEFLRISSSIIISVVSASTYVPVLASRCHCVVFYFASILCHHRSVRVRNYDSHTSSYPHAFSAVINMFTGLWMWKESFQHHEQLPVAFNGTWPSWNSDLDNKLW
jgi:hypothetical protein